MSRRICLALAVLASGAAAAQAPPAGPPPTVSVAKPVVKEVVERDEFTGRFEAVENVDVRARVSGYLQDVHFADGSLVRKGDLLFSIDQRPYRAVLDQAQANLVSAQARQNFAQTDLERAQTLSRSGNISEQVTDQRRQTAQVAQADIESASGALRQAQLNLEFTQVKSPISGRIGRRLVTPGNLIGADQTQLTTIVSTDPIYFYFAIDERSFIKYQEATGVTAATQGQTAAPVTVRLTGETNPRQGQLGFVDNRLDNATATILLRATLPNPDGFIKPGMFGTVTVPASRPKRGVLVPDEAIATNQDRRIVYAVADDGTVSAKVVQIGPRIDGYRLIPDGLRGDETIVIAGLQRARPGAKVTPDVKTLTPTR